MDKHKIGLNEWLGIVEENNTEVEQEEKKEELFIPVHEPRLCNT